MTELRITLPSIPLSTRLVRTGSGPPVLLLHGNPDSAGEWHALSGLIGTRYTTLAPDLPGFGACDEPPSTFDYGRDACTSFVEELLARLGVREPVILVVHDIGGVVGIPWAVRHLERVRGVVITNTVVFEDFPWFPIAHTWARTDAFGRARAAFGMSLLGVAGGRLFRRVFGRLSPELAEADLARMTREFARDAKSKRCTLRMFRAMLAPGYFDGFSEMLRILRERVPVRVVWGRNDPFLGRTQPASIGAPLELIDGAHGGHWIPITAAPHVAAAIDAVAV